MDIQSIIYNTLNSCSRVKRTETEITRERVEIRDKNTHIKARETQDAFKICHKLVCNQRQRAQPQFTTV